MREAELPYQPQRDWVLLQRAERFIDKKQQIKQHECLPTFVCPCVLYASAQTTEFGSLKEACFGLLLIHETEEIRAFCVL
jgi:hypothetical protein